MMDEFDKAINDVHEAVNKLLNIAGQGELDDDKSTKMEQLEQEVSDKLTTFLSDHGVEIGDERVD
jgi:hypothetical protein